VARGCKITCKRNLTVLLQSRSYFFQNNDDAKVILANAVQHVGQSVKIWLAAADLEQDVKRRNVSCVKVYHFLEFYTGSLLTSHTALENIPNSVRLWKEM